MIDALTVWHGPTYPLYSKGAEEHLANLDTTVIDCAESSPNSLGEALPQGSILASDINGVWLRGLHHWKAADVSKAVKFLKEHDLNFDVAVTSDKAPVKAILDLADNIYDFSIPKNAKAYATQIEDWLLMQGRSTAPGVAAKLVDYCSPEPQAAQQIAVTLASQPEGRSLEWEDVKTIAAEVVKAKQPVWELGKAIASGDADKAMDALANIDNDEPFMVLRYLENRYRILLLATSPRMPTSRILEAFPKVNEWSIKAAVRESNGLTPRHCSRALTDISQALALILESGRSSASSRAALEQCIITLSARHRSARRS